MEANKLLSSGKPSFVMNLFSLIVVNTPPPPHTHTHTHWPVHPYASYCITMQLVNMTLIIHDDV